MNVLVSVVIPAFNAERYIGDAIRSVLAQSHRALEIIVVDDGSTDATRSVVAELRDPRLRVLAKPNGGLASARNAGFKEAKGSAVAFLDADDLFDPEKLEKQLAFLQSKNAVAVGSPMRLLSADGGRSLGTIGKQARQQDLRTARIMPVPISSMLFSAEAVRQAGEFDEALRQVEDLDFVARIANVGPVLVTEEVLGAYRLHHQSMTATGQSEQQMYSDFVRARIAARRAGTCPPELDSFRRSYRVPARVERHKAATAQYRAAGLALVNGHHVAAVGQIVRAAAGSPVFMARMLGAKLGRELARVSRRRPERPISPR